MRKGRIPRRRLARDLADRHHGRRRRRIHGALHAVHRAGAGERAIRENQSHYCPSPGLPVFREAAAKFVHKEFGIPACAENIVVGPGAKIFEQFFCEAFLNPGDGVLVFSPHFPTFLPNIERRQARAVLAPLRQESEFRPDIGAIEKFVRTDPAPKAVFLNSPHNPTGGVATAEDLKSIADPYECLLHSPHSPEGEENEERTQRPHVLGM